MGCECWNSVSLYGPDEEIGRFRRLCIDLPPGSDPQSVRGGWDGYEVEIGFRGIVPAGRERSSRLGTTIYASNYRERAPEAGRWSFAFDTTHGFPVDEFEELASLFPMLHFNCECIDSMDDYMGFGWFNVTQGGEAFRQDMAVPSNYWTGGGGFKRTPGAHAKHMALVETLTQASQRAGRDYGF